MSGTATPVGRLLAALVGGGLMLPLLAAGCGSTPTTHVYTLATPGPDAGGGARASGGSSGNADPRVGVLDFRVEPPYDQSRIVYRVGEDSPELRFYAYHRWARPLSQELANAAAESLRTSLATRAVEPARPGRRYAAFLVGHLVQLEEITLPDGVLARVRLELELRSSDGILLWENELGATNRVARGELGSVAELVRLLRRTLDDALAQDRAGLRGALEGLAREPRP